MWIGYGAIIGRSVAGDKDSWGAILEAELLYMIGVLSGAVTPIHLHWPIPRLDILRCPAVGICHGLSAGYVPAGADGSVADTGTGVVSP